MKWVVTSAWPYASDVPHLGNLIGSALSADVFARYHRLVGDEVVFVSGSDEHGTPIEVEAVRRGVSPKEFAETNHKRISELFKAWEISFDNYTETESAVHIDFVRDHYMKVYRNGYVFTQVERVHYCPRDKRFLPDRFVEGTCPHCGFRPARGDQCDNCGRPLDSAELIDPYCVLCSGKTVLRETTQWFFDLPKLSDYVMDYLNRAELSENVVNFSKSWVRAGLRPRSLTRDSEWGIRAPFPNAEGKTIYVWMEAVLGYVSAVIEYFRTRSNPDGWRDYWLNPNSKTSFFIGKDNIPFHSIILPALLKASGENYNEPSLISSTEFLTFEGQKFSKSRRIGIWIDEALELLPADYWRYTLISMRPEVGDVDFGWGILEEKVNAELNDAIGNFANRTLIGVQRFASGRFDFSVHELSPRYTGSLEEILRRHAEIGEHYSKAELRASCRLALEQAAEANRFLSMEEPWKLAKTDKQRSLEVLYVALTALKALAVELEPIVPKLAAEIIAQAGFFKKRNGKPKWAEISIDEDLPIEPKSVAPVVHKVSAQELKAKLEEFRSRRKESVKAGRS
ncbi:MAG: methionine--tRNA ligase [Thermoprotei archaeon]